MGKNRSCQRNLIKPFQIEGMIAMITRMDMIFMRLVKWPKIAVKKKPKFSEILVTKVIQFWCYTNSMKTKNVPLN